MTNPAEQDYTDLDHPVIEAKGTASGEGLHVWLPSGVEIHLPRHEVLILRDLCNSYMAKFGATDAFGNAIAEWNRPHPPLPVESAPQTSDTEPSGTGQQDATQ